MKKINQRGKNTVKVSINALKTHDAMEEESKVALTRSSGNNRSAKYNFFQCQGFSFKKWEARSHFLRE